WRVGVGLLACTFSAREVMVSTLAQVYIPEEIPAGGQAPRGLAALLRSPDPESGKAPLSLAGALSLLVYFVFALQCVSTVVVMHRETNGWKWPAFAFAYMTALAWIAAWITFQAAA
ncbi:MAG: ferrous iron transport protein B, partial [Planctomycetota bacterium]